jgi:phosphatidylethanolamine-binding protein (PEBP) family uncharacterized protein
MTVTRSARGIFGATLALLAAWGCSSGGSGGTTGAAGKSGSAGKSGAAGASSAGTAGAGAAGTGVAGTTGAGGASAGTAGSTTGGAGSGGAGGSATAGSGGTTGAAGSVADGGAMTSGPDAGASADGGPFTLTSTSFKAVDGGLVFPAAQSAPMNQSPQLTWSGVPEGTLSLALTMYDASLKNTHFILYDLPLTLAMLPAGLPRGAMPTTPTGAKWISAFGGTPGYEGPGGGSVDSYELVLWAIKSAHLDVGTMSLNQIHSTLLPAQSLGSAQILAKGMRNGL